jgi:GNAT superfamily N-acetyltransferase
VTTLETSRGPLTLKVAGAEHTEPLLEFFARLGHPCYCRYWHHEGPTNSWLERLFLDEAGNRAWLDEQLRTGAKEASGVVALYQSVCAAGTPTSVVGWMKVAPASALRKVYQQRPFRALKCFDDRDESRAFAVACFLVDPAWRRLGVARGLLNFGLELAREKGASCVEAFPNRSADCPPEQLLSGPALLFEQAGFEELASMGPYSAVRRAL